MDANVEIAIKKTENELNIKLTHAEIVIFEKAFFLGFDLARGCFEDIIEYHY